MAKRRKKAREKTFEEMLEKNGEDFAEEINILTKKIGIDIEKGYQKKHDDWGFSVFGIVGPLVGSVIGVLFLTFFVWILKFINLGIGSSLISSVINFVLGNMHWLFALFLFLGYNDYFSKRNKKTFWIVAPFVGSIVMLFVLWMAIWTLDTINLSANSIFLAYLSNSLYSNMVPIAFAFIVLDYVIIVIEKTIIFKGLK